MEPDLELLSPWITPSSANELASELEREVGPGHPLFRKEAKALALATDRDDVLFEIFDGSQRKYAVVHLTWSGKMERSARWPDTQFFDSLAQWLQWMKADHEGYPHGE